jgi:protoporphyrinogen oxidase
VVGGGPAGLTAAWELSRLGERAVVLERDELVGGISRTVEHRGYRFDLGGHRFFTKSEEVQRIWEEILGEDLLERPRLSRILYANRYFDYPLKPMNALAGLGVVEAARVVASYGHALLFPERNEKTFEQWVSNRFGRRLFEIFFKTYTEKVWGLACSEISSDWAAQRIKNLDLLRAIRAAILGAGQGAVITTLIDRFLYPRHGPGMMWERCRDLLAERGSPTLMGSEVTAIRHSSGRVVAVDVRQRDGAVREMPADHVICSMALGQAVAALDPAPPPEILAAARALRHRDFLTVVLIADVAEIFPDNWIYVHSPEVKVGRIQNFKNWSPEMVADARHTALGLEYFVNRGDELWESSDEALIALGRAEMATLGILDPAKVLDGAVVRVPQAYPLYDGDYARHLETLRGFLASLPNLQMVGRNGQHRYNNQDHSMLTGIYAARNVAAGHSIAALDVWSVNLDDEYHETVATRRGDRLSPARVGRETVEDLLAAAFRGYDPLAMSVAVGSVTALFLFLATGVLVARGGESVGSTLSLLSIVMFGYEVSWRGALVGLLEGGILGGGLGWLIAQSVNRAVRLAESALRRHLAAEQALDPIDGTEA